MTFIPNPGPRSAQPFVLPSDQSFSISNLSSSVQCIVILQASTQNLAFLRLGRSQTASLLLPRHHWNTIPTTHILINMYSPIRREQPGRLGGVLLFTCVQNIIFSFFDQWIPGTEALWFWLTAQHRQLLVGAFYRPSDSLIKETVDTAYKRTTLSFAFKQKN